MRNNAGRMYQRTALRNGGRKAGAGVQEADYSEESGPGGKTYRDRERVRLPHDGDKPENLNGPCIIVQAGKPKEPKLKAVSYEEARLAFFREQLRAANKRLDCAVRNRYPETVCADRGDAVSFYSDIIKILEERTQ